MGDVVRFDGKEYVDIVKCAKKLCEGWESDPAKLPREVVTVVIGKEGNLEVHAWGEKSDMYSGIVHLELAALSLKSSMLFGEDEGD